MSENTLMARQPILDNEKKIFGYEFFYRAKDGSSQIDDPRLATSTVLVNILNQIGYRSSAEDAKAFINVGENILLTDILYTLPKEKFVYELSEDIRINSNTRESIKKLSDLGYIFALDNVELNEIYLSNFHSILPYITYLKFNTNMTDIERLGEKISQFSDKKLIAQYIEIPEIYEAYKKLGFHYYQGYFFAKPNILQRTSLDPKHIGVIRIFEMLQNGDTLNNIAEAFSKHNELSLQLMQFLSSTYKGQIEKTSSIQDVVSLLGKDKLMQWLLLIIYSKTSQTIEHEKSAISLLVENRIDLMIGVIEVLQPLEFERMIQESRYIALISLLETVFNVPLVEILKNFSVSDNIHEALLSRTGTLGRVYTLALSIEQNDYAATQVLLSNLNLHVEDIDHLINKV